MLHLTFDDMVFSVNGNIGVCAGNKVRDNIAETVVARRSGSSIQAAGEAMQGVSRGV